MEKERKSREIGEDGKGNGREKGRSSVRKEGKDNNIKFLQGRFWKKIFRGPGPLPKYSGYRVKWEMGRGIPILSRLEGLGERSELPQRGPGRSPGHKRILAHLEGHRTLLV